MYFYKDCVIEVFINEDLTFDSYVTFDNGRGWFEYVGTWKNREIARFEAVAFIERNRLIYAGKLEEFLI